MAPEKEEEVDDAEVDDKNEDDPDLAYTFRVASGPSLDDCHFLADRYLGPSWSEDMAESWVGQLVDGEMHLLKGQVGWLTDLWRSNSGHVYVAEGSSLRGGVHIAGPDPRAPQWKFHELPITCVGVWGLDDRSVFAWGDPDGDGSNGVFRWDGKGWRGLPAPGQVMAMHGAGPDHIYAVGYQGLLAKLDGSTWRRIPTHVQWDINSVHIVGPDEMYACGDGGLLEGTVHGWSVINSHDGYLRDVKKFKDAVWVADKDEGLFHLSGQKLKSVLPDLELPMSLDTRDRLLIACEQSLAETRDGKRVKTLPIAKFVAQVRQHPEQW